MSRRSRSRSSRALPVAVLVIALLCGVTILPAASYSTADVGRGTALGVADDPNAILGLDVTDNVTVGTTDQLVVVTNGFDTDVTITVTLRDDSTAMGNLSAPDGSTGDTVSFSLATGTSKTVDVDVADDSGIAGEELYFHVSAEAADVDATASDRQTTITD